jgi:hypothetical protein
MPSVKSSKELSKYAKVIPYHNHSAGYCAESELHQKASGAWIKVGVSLIIKKQKKK